jgi:hypothetical protein
VNYSVLDTCRSRFSARRFSALREGCEVRLPTGNTLSLRVRRLIRINEKALFRFLPYSYLAEIDAGDFQEVGCGEANSPLLAMQKSLAEAFERCLFRSLKGTAMGTKTSSGWAAHTDWEKAERAALYELLERDAVMLHALREEPMYEIHKDTLPAWLQEWQRSEMAHTQLSDLKVLFSRLGHIPSISVAFLNYGGYGVIAHACDTSIERALERALSEACRLGRVAMSGLYRERSAALFSNSEGALASVGAWEHAVAYAHHRPLPKWLYGEVLNFAQAAEKFQKRMRSFELSSFPYEFVRVADSPFVAGYCHSSEVQNLFFGRTSDAERSGDLNSRRLNHSTPLKERSAFPHFVA